MSFLLLTKSSTFLIGPISSLLGYLMNFIYECTSSIGIENIGLCIILFTIIVNLIMIPLNIKQQKSSKMMAVVNPEIQAINAKYRNKTDQDSMMRMRNETSAVYEKYGVSMGSGCLPLLIQLPILYALYPIIRNIPAYVSGIKNVFMSVATVAVAQSDWLEKIADLASSNKIDIANLAGDTTTSMNYVVDLLALFDRDEWSTFLDLFPSISDTIQPYVNKIIDMNYFLGGINLAEAPGLKLSIALIIPICAGLFSWLNMRIAQSGNPQPASPSGENNMADSMKMMNNFMPLMSAAFCIYMPAGLGLYWAASSASRCVIQFFVNRYINTLDVNKLTEKNIEKKNKKRARQGLPPIRETVNKNTASKTFKELEAENKEKFKEADYTMSEKAKNQLKKSNDYYNDTSNPGSISSRAAMVKKYNEKTNKKN